MPAGDPGRDPIELLLAGRYPDPDSGELLAAESRAVVIADSLDGSDADLVADLGLGSRFALLADDNTYAALGRRVQRALQGRFSVQTIVLPGAPAPHADGDTVARIGRLLEPGIDAVIAVGSGTLNDLAKMVAFERGCAQLVFATAPSMNGYTSVSASITRDGVKRSYRTRTPVAAFFDLHVLAAAPARLVRAGVGDSVCRATAQADWLLSHLLLDRPYREIPFRLLADDERELFARIGPLVRGEVGAMRHLVRTLVLSGFGMTLCNGSFPASQGEHLLSHYVEMKQPGNQPHAFHGEQIGVCTLAMARLQELLLARDTPELAPTTLTRAHVLDHYGPAAGEACWSELAHKTFDRPRTDELNERLATQWSVIGERIRAVTPGVAVLSQVLAEAGAPREPHELGWPATLFTDAIHYARAIRNRYTFLDLAGDLRS